MIKFALYLSTEFLLSRYLCRLHQTCYLTASRIARKRLSWVELSWIELNGTVSYSFSKYFFSEPLNFFWKFRILKERRCCLVHFFNCVATWYIFCFIVYSSDQVASFSSPWTLSFHVRKFQRELITLVLPSHLSVNLQLVFFLWWKRKEKSKKIWPSDMMRHESKSS